MGTLRDHLPAWANGAYNIIKDTNSSVSLSDLNVGDIIAHRKENENMMITATSNRPHLYGVLRILPGHSVIAKDDINVLGEYEQGAIDWVRGRQSKVQRVSHLRGFDVASAYTSDVLIKEQLKKLNANLPISNMFVELDDRLRGPLGNRVHWGGSIRVIADAHAVSQEDFYEHGLLNIGFSMQDGTPRYFADITKPMNTNLLQ